jgi:hypothetical protein
MMAFHGPRSQSVNYTGPYYYIDRATSQFLRKVPVHHTPRTYDILYENVREK